MATDRTRTHRNTHEPKLDAKSKVHYERLMALREQMVEELESLSGYSLTTNKQAGEELADIGSDNFIREMELGLLSEEVQKLKSVDQAIQRLFSGTYGLCQECNKAIQDGRLEAIPYATLCVA